MASNPPFITVVIPAFNAEKHIEATLSSVRAQTLEDFEVIVVNDGSSDKTAEIVRNFSRSDTRFTLLEQPNTGISAARNKAIEYARGEWIAFIDADDIWLPEKLARQLELSRQEPRANFLFTNYCTWNGEKDGVLGYQPNEPIPHGEVMEKLIFRFLFLPSTVMTRRQLLHNAGLFNVESKISEDWEMWIRLALNGLFVAGTSEPLVRYRRWSGSMTAKKHLKSLEANVELLQKYFPFIVDIFPNLREACLQSITFKRTAFEIASAHDAINGDQSLLPGIIWRFWQRERRSKWLRWYLCLRWPLWLGGKYSREMVYNKIRKRWPAPAVPLTTTILNVI